MEESNKREFWAIVNVTMDLMDRPPLSKEAILVWWNMLNKYSIEDVRNALDKWCNTEKKSPTPKDIIDLCKAQQVKIEPAKLPSPVSRENNKRHAEEFKRAINEVAKPQRDHKAWAKQIIANPSRYPAISLDFAREALK